MRGPNGQTGPCGGAAKASSGRKTFRWWRIVEFVPCGQSDSPGTMDNGSFLLPYILAYKSKLSLGELFNCKKTIQKKSDICFGVCYPKLIASGQQIHFVRKTKTFSEVK